MAERRPRAVLFPPGGLGLAAALAQTAKPGAVVTAVDDQTLGTARRLLDDRLEDLTLRSFSETIAWVARMIGLPTARRTGPSQLRAMVAQAASRLPQLSPLASARLFPGTAQAIGQTLTELHYHGHSPASLRQAADQIDTPLADKLRDLADLEEDVRRQMEATHQEFGADRARTCLDQTVENPLPIPKLVMIAGQESAPLYDRWINWLAAQGVEVDVLVESLGPANPAFKSQAATKARLNPTLTVEVKAPDWTSRLFTSQTTQNAPNIQILDCPDPLAECESALRQCYQASQNNTPWPNIGLFIRDPDRYAPLLIASAKRLGVPIDLRLSQDLLANGFATLVLQTLKALASPDVRELAKTVASSYYGLDENRRAEIRKICRDAYRAEDPWQHLAESLENQEGYEAVIGALDWRAEYKEGPQTVRQWKAALIDLCTHTPFLDRMVESSLTVDRDTRAQALMQRSIDDIALQVGDQPLNLAEFAEQAAAVWNLEKVVWGTFLSRHAPDRPDAVKVCTSTHQLADFDQLIVLGMLEGTMPRRRTEDPVLSDEERQLLNQKVQHTDPLPTSHDKAATERDEFLRLCGSARNQIIFSYPETDDQKDNIPAFYLQETKRAVPAAETHTHHRSAIVPPAGQAVLYADHRLRQALDAPLQDFPKTTLTDPDAANIAKRDPEKPFTPAELAEALLCPFRAFARHTLQLTQPPNKTLLSLIRNVPGKVVLVRFDDLEEARAHLKAQVKEDFDRQVPHLYHWEQRLFEKGSNRLVGQWVEREWEAREMWGIRNQKVEAPALVGGPEGFEWKVGDRMIQINQKVSAVTRFEGKTLATLYRSSCPEIKPEKAFDESLGDTVEIGLTLLGMLKETPDPYLQIEGLESRRLYAFVRPDLGPRLKSYDPKIDLNILTLEDDRTPGQRKRDFCENLRTHVAEAVNRLVEPDVRPTPGPVCENCRFADLCRRHWQDGEQNRTLAPEKETP